MRTRRHFTAEFKAEAVRLCRARDRSIAQVAQDLDLTDSALRRWVEQSPTPSAPSSLSGGERDELLRLRQQVKRLQMEREILKKAAAFFAKENE